MKFTDNEREYSAGVIVTIYATADSPEQAAALMLLALGDAEEVCSKVSGVNLEWELQELDSDD
jgi:hypothetical protein